MAGLIAKDTLHFVGGRGTLAGDADAGGGCTEAAWDASGSLSDFMDTNGEPWTKIDDDSAAVTDRGDGKVRVTKASAFDHTEIVVGTIAYIYNYSGGTDGRYEVLAVDVSDNYVDLDLTHGGDDVAVSCIVGGAFDTLQNAIDKADEADNANRYLWSNKDEILTAGLAVNISGTVAKDYHVFIKAFHTTPGDMDGPDGTYYGGAINAFNDYNSYPLRNSNAAWGVIDGDGGSYDLIDNNKQHNVHWHNYHFKNITGTRYLFYGSSVSGPTNGGGVTNCRFEDTSATGAGVYGKFNGFYVNDCYFGDTQYYGSYFDSSSNGVSISNSIYDMGNTANDRCVHIDGAGATIKNCLFLNANYAGVRYKGNGLCNVYNNTFYGCGMAFDISGANSIGAAWNNIFDMPAIDDYAVRIDDTNLGSLAYCDYNCAYSTAAGAALTIPYYDKTKDAAIPQIGSNNIQKDPMFDNAAGGNFALGALSPCLGGGDCNFIGYHNNVGCNFAQPKGNMGIAGGLTG